MPVAQLNNTETQNSYVDALTVEFPFMRPGFSLDISNATVYYQLAYMMPGDRQPVWQALETVKLPTLNSFNNPVMDGLPAGSLYGGIRLRSAIINTPARVTVA